MRSAPHRPPVRATAPPDTGLRRAPILAAGVLLAALLPGLGTAGEAVGEASPIAIDLPGGLPESVEIALELGGEARKIRLHRRSFRASGFRVRTWSVAGGEVEVVPPPPSTYVGSLVGDDGSRVAGSLGPAGLTARLETGSGAVWRVRPAPGKTRGLHLVLAGGDPLPEGRECGIGHPDRGGVEAFHPPGPPATDPPATDDGDGPSGAWQPRDWCGSSGMKLAEIAFDVDNPYYVNLGSDVAAVVANVEGHMAVVDEYYARDALITYQITDILVRTDPFYFPDANDGPLTLFRDEWNANQTAVPRDMAHLMTGQPDPGIAGLAYVSVTCNLAWAYGYSVDSARVVGHELGHNWAAGHCHDTSPCNNMCGACLYIAPRTKDIIMAHRDSRTCLDDVGPYAPPVPPYAHPDRAVIERNVAAGRIGVLLDVLENDHDANCDNLTIDAFDERTPLGGSVERYTWGDPDERDRLWYTPPCTLFAGVDEFGYTLGDATGEQDSTTVTVDVLDRGLVGCWLFDDAAGSTAADATGHRRDGSLNGAAAWGFGLYGGTLLLDGTDGYVEVPPLNVTGEELTIVAWMRRSGDQDPWAGLVFSRGAGTTAGLNFGTANELRYHWNGSAATYNWDSGLHVPDGQWVLAALIVTPDDATIHLHDGTLRSATNTIAHPPQTFEAATSIGRDPNGDPRHFAGDIDEVRIYDHALTPPEIEELYEVGGGADAPRPADGGFLRDPGANLTWTPGHAADSHNVYFGTDYFALRDANTTSPEYRGNTVGALYDPPDLLDQGRTYLWRVDTWSGPRLIPGDVWLFTVDAPTPGLAGYWTLDDAPGPAAADSSRRDRHGTLVGGPLWTTGTYGGGLGFDGVDDAVEIPPLDLEGSQATIAVWLRRSGSQPAWAGILFSRDDGTTAGLNFGNANELRYHWNNDGATWGWDSGLVVPDDQWVLAALVIEPEQATIHLHDGTLRSATNVVSHVPQTFSGISMLGRDPTSTARSFRGTLDEVRVYDYPLSPAEIVELHDLGGPAVAPDPPDGARLSDPPGQLSWVPSPAAGSHDVYFGLDHAAVDAATPADPEFQGNQPGVTHAPATGIQQGTTYYWRIDEKVGPSTVKGRTWRFSMEEGVGATLRVERTGTDWLRLRWRDVGSSSLYDLQRCSPPPADGCVPATFATVGPRRDSDVVEGLPGTPLIWYRVSRVNPCAP